MPYISPLDAFVSTLKTKTAVTDILGGTAKIFPIGRVQGQQGSPYITVMEHITRGRPNTAHLTVTMRVRAYFGDNSGNASTVLITALIKTIKESMHLADLGTITDIGFMECRWSGYQSGTLYDYGGRDYYQEVRFDIQLGHALP